MHKGPDKKEDGVKWTSRSIGSKLQHNIFYTLIRFGGTAAAYAALNCVALYYTLCKPAVRKKADPYLTRRFRTGNHFTRLLDCYRLYVGLGKALIDRAVIGIKGPGHMHITCSDQDILTGLINEGRGLVLLTAHVGCWQVAMSALRSLNTPVSLLLHREEGDVDLHYFEHSGSPAPFRIINPMGYLGGVLEMMQVLRAGEILCVMGDRLFGGKKGSLEVDFLGGTVLFPMSAFKIASVTGAPIVVLYSYKSGPSSYALEIYDIIHVPSEAGKHEHDLVHYVREFALTLEKYTTAHPYQFFNFYDMWIEDSQIIEEKRGILNEY